MQVIVSGKCSNCGTLLDSYHTKPLNRSVPEYFGPRVLRCPKCNAYYVNERAVELATLNEKSLNYYRKEFATSGNIWICSIICVLSIVLAAKFFSEAWVNQGYNAVIVLFLGFGVPYAILYLLKYYVFFNGHLRESEERMNDPEYVKQIKEYNKLKYGRE